MLLNQSMSNGNKPLPLEKGGWEGFSDGQIPLPPPFSKGEKSSYLGINLATMNKKTIGVAILLSSIIVSPKSAHCTMTVNGPISASTVTVTGSVTMSSVTASNMTVLNLLNMQGTINGVVVQTVYSSTTVNSTTASSTLTPIPNMSAAIALSSANDYIRITLSGILEASFDGSNYTPNVNVSIQRDSTDLGNGALATTDNLNGIPVGISITDSPGDISLHTYSATFDVSGSTTVIVSFTASPVGYLLLEEIARE
jgi:hypothetical protein